MINPIFADFLNPAGVGLNSMRTRFTIRKLFLITFLIALSLTVLSFAVAPANLAFAQGTEVDSGLGKIQGPFSGINFDTSNPYRLVASLITLALQIGFMIAVVFVIIGGYMYVTSAGNEETAEKGRKTIINAIIGLVIVILSYSIVTVISNTINK